MILGAESHDMVKNDSVPGIYEFDYKLPPGQTSIGYYFLVSYSTEGNGMLASRQAYTELSHAAVVSHYVVSLEVNRGPVGARIGVLGRGFSPQDLIGFDGTAVRTVYESPTSLGFFVPALAPGKTYRVTLSGSAGNSDIGTFRIDSSDVTAEPASLALAPGQKQSLTFTVTHPAPAGGLLLDITTDVPAERHHARGGRPRGPDLRHRDRRGRQARHGQPVPQGLRQRRGVRPGHGGGRPLDPLAPGRGSPPKIV